jgi:hypothetical protein
MLTPKGMTLRMIGPNVIEMKIAQGARRKAKKAPRQAMVILFSEMTRDLLGGLATM